MSLNYYDVLGLDEDATREQLRAAMLAAMRIYDANPSAPGAHAAASQVTSAWRTLQDPESRRAYDEQLHAVRRIPVVSTSAGRNRLNEITGAVLSVIVVVAVGLAAAGAYFLVGGAVGVFAVLVAYAVFQGSSDDCGVGDCDCEPASEREYTQSDLENGVHLWDGDS